VLMWVQEYNGSNQNFFSGESDFELQSSNGQAYQMSFSAVAQHELAGVSLPPLGRNTGWIGFEVPQQSDTYAVLWQESFLSGWQTICHVTVGADGSVSGCS
jgi:Domain of unknown function (DUF4352)